MNVSLAHRLFPWLTDEYFAKYGMYYDDMKIETNEHDQKGTHRLMIDHSWGYQ